MKKHYGLKFAVLLAVLVASMSQLMATHIVGGEIGYRCLGDDQYEVILSVYRDCLNAGPDTEFDDPAIVGIFRNSDGMLIGTLDMFFMQDDTLQEFLLDDCLVVQQPVCVHTSTYRETVTLPFIEGGYELAYQRCCRNTTINNIINPTETGATYNVQLSEAALLNCNSSPQFREWPPIYVCAGEFISYDHSAIDMDGDSLVYRICTPNTGATEERPRPSIPSRPPYDEVEWVAPTYSEENVLGAGRALSINPRNGRIIARPELIGQFVVGICVEEYRDGVLLSETRRDFQYNVVPCTVTEAEPVTLGDFQCEDLTVNFSNGSRDANDFLWTFDRLGDSTQISTEFEPSYTYPDTGTYVVQLIAEPGNVCADTAFLNITLIQNSVTAGLDIQTFDCGDTTIATFTDASMDTLSFINIWQWDVDIAGEMFEGDDESVTFILPRDTSGTVELTVRSNLGCTETISQPFQTGISDPTSTLPDTLFVCEGDTVQLNPMFDPEDTFFNFRWRGGALSSPNTPNPSAAPRNTTTYTARIFPPNSACEVEHDVMVVVQESPQALSIETLPDCISSTGLRFTGIVEGTDSLFWNFGDTSNIAFIPGGREIAYAYPDTGVYEVQLVAVGSICSDTLTQLVTVTENDIESDVSVSIEQTMIETCADSVMVSAMVNNAVSVFWFNEENVLVSSDQMTTLGLEGETLFRVEATSETGCVASDTIRIISRAINVDLPGDQDLCLGDTLDLGITNLGLDAVNYRWTPDSLIISGADTANPVVTDTVGERFYDVFFDNEFGCQDSAQIRVTVIDPDLDLTFNTAIQCDGTSVSLVNTTPVEYSRYQWLLGDSLNTEIIGDSIIFNYQVSDTFEVCLTLDYNAVCVDTTCQMVTTLEGDQELTPQFNFEIVECAEDSLTIRFIDESISTFDTVSYRWRFGEGGMMATEQNPVMTFTRSELLGVNLTLQASDECESSIMQAIQIDVPSLNLDSITTLCSGEAIALNIGGNENLIYRWSPTEGLSDSTAASPVANPMVTTTYSVIVTHPLAPDCQITGSTTVDVDGSIDLGLPAEITTCGEDFELGIPPISGISIRWVNDSGIPIIGDTVLVSGDYEGIYFVELADTTGCAGRDTVNIINRGLNIIEPIGDTITTCEGQTVRVGLSNGNPNDTLRVAWTPLELITRDSNTISPTFFGFTDTIMTLYYTAENQFGCTLSDSLAFKIRDFDVRLPDDDFAVCADSPTPLNPDFNENLEYTWSPATGLDDPTLGNPTITISDSTTYDVLVTVGEGVGACRDSFQVDVGIREAALLTFADENPAVCDSEPITLSVSADREVTYEWSDTPDFDMILGEGESITVMPDLGAAEYFLRVTETDGDCVSVDMITVNNFPIDVSLPDVSEVCIEGGTTLLVTNNGLEQNLTYEWSPEEFIIDGQGTATPTIDADASGILQATVTNEFGCETMISTDLELIDLSTSENIVLNALPDTIVLGGSSQLQIFTPEGFEFDWTPSATLDNPISATPIASPDETTLYTVEITQGNCIGSRDIEITVLTDVCREPYIFVPAAFTPNGDGRNDILFVRGVPIEELFFAVYNRWGEPVFQTTDQSIGWDGTFNGRALNSDVYGYYLEVTCVDGMEFTRQGNVTILR